MWKVEVKKYTKLTANPIQLKQCILTLNGVFRQKKKLCNHGLTQYKKTYGIKL